MSKQFIVILIVIVGGLFAILNFTNKDTSETAVSSSNQGSSHVVGKADSKVKVTEYGDFQCPACKAYEPIVSQIRTDYADKIAFEFKNFPLTQIHNNAFISSRAAEAASKQNKFWEMHDLLYEQQASWSSLPDPTEVFIGFARQLDLDVTKFRSDMTSQEVSDIINADRKQAQDLGATGTPTFAINGKRLDKTPTTFEEFKKLIDEEIAKN